MHIWGSIFWPPGVLIHSLISHFLHLIWIHLIMWMWVFCNAYHEIVRTVKIFVYKLYSVSFFCEKNVELIQPLHPLPPPGSIYTALQWFWRNAIMSLFWKYFVVTLYYQMIQSWNVFVHTHTRNICGNFMKEWVFDTMGVYWKKPEKCLNAFLYSLMCGLTKQGIK